MQSMPFTTKVVSSNPAHGEVYLINHYVIKFDSDIQQISGFLQTDRHNLAEILLKVTLNTITLTLYSSTRQVQVTHLQVYMHVEFNFILFTEFNFRFISKCNQDVACNGFLNKLLAFANLHNNWYIY